MTILLLTSLLGGGCASGPYQVQDVREATYATHPDAQGADAPLTLDLYRPVGQGPFPAVLLIHGGSWRTGRSWEMAPLARRLAAQGIVAASLTYRLAPEHHYPAQLEDVRAAIRWLREHAGELALDPARVGAWGYSAGAHLALLAALREDGPGTTPGGTSTRLSAVVAGGPPTDLLLFGENELVANFIGGTIAQMPDVYRDASPITFVSAGDPPVYLYHGQHDWIVDPEHTHRLADALRRAGVPVQVEQPFFGHMASFLFGSDAEDDGVRFLVRQLRAGTP